MEKNAAPRDALRQQLGITDASLGFLVLILLSVLLSFSAVLRQRGQLARTIEGGGGPAPDVFPVKWAAGALVVGSLGFFFTLALDLCKTAARGEDDVAKRSASANLWASVLVFAAALIRQWDLDYVHRSQPALTQTDDLPA